MLQPILIPSNDKYIEVTIPSAEMFRTKLDFDPTRGRGDLLQSQLYLKIFQKNNLAKAQAPGSGWSGKNPKLLWNDMVDGSPSNTTLIIMKNRALGGRGSKALLFSVKPIAF